MNNIMKTAFIIKWILIIFVASIFFHFVSEYINIPNDFFKSILIGFITAIIIVLPLNYLGDYIIKKPK